MRATRPERQEIAEYIAVQAHEDVVHVEKVASEMVGPVRHDIWDVHCPESRWWAVTNPLNLYSQDDFKSRDVVLTFHVGLALRLSYLNDREVPVAGSAAELLPGSWRRWQQAFDAYDDGDEAENFQAVGMRLRECLVSFVAQATSKALVPEGTEPPKAADVIGWIELLADQITAGRSSAKLRSYLKTLGRETWQYVNWLTHAKNAMRIDAEIGLKAVEHLLGTFTAARLRVDRVPTRCSECGSYEVAGGVCRHCGWTDPDYQPRHVRPLTDEEIAERLAQPCTSSSDISTFMTIDDLHPK